MSLFLGLVLSTLNPGQIHTPTVPNEIVMIQGNTLVGTQVLGVSLDDELGDWIDALARKENCDPKGTWDVHSYSYGKYCYKVPFFTEQIRKYGLAPDTEDGEILNIIGNEEIQDKLTRLIFENQPSHWVKWGCSVRPQDFPVCMRLGITGGIGLPPR